MEDMMGEAKVWVEQVIIPTYEVGEAEKNPMFLDKRVYQGSSGKVYPYPAVEKISNTKTDKEYTAVFLENEYVKVMVLPQLGGRIQSCLLYTSSFVLCWMLRNPAMPEKNCVCPWNAIKS